MASRPERRKDSRLSFTVPIEVHIQNVAAADGRVSGVTRDVCAGGFYSHAAAEPLLAQGMLVRVRMTIPPDEQTEFMGGLAARSGRTLILWADATVLRCEIIHEAGDARQEFAACFTQRPRITVAEDASDAKDFWLSDPWDGILPLGR